MHCSDTATIMPVQTRGRLTFLRPVLQAAVLATCLVAGYATRADELAHGDSSLASFLQQHCSQCHSDEEAEGDFRLESLSGDLSNRDARQRWVFLHDRVARGEMPPAFATEIAPADRAGFLSELSRQLITAERGHRPIFLRRLNRREYINTVNDLFGIEVQLENVLIEERLDQGFDTIGATLSLSPEQMLLYLDAADLVLDEVFGPDVAPQQVHYQVNAKDLRSTDTADRVDDDGVVLFSGAKSLPMYGIAVRGPATYRLTVEVQAIQTDVPIVMQVEGGVTGRIPGHSAGFFEVLPDRKTTIEVIDRAVESSDTFAFRLRGGFPWWSVNAEEYAGVGLWIGDITVEGPLEEWPRPSRGRLLGGSDVTEAGAKELRAIVQRILPQAFRRPVAESEAAVYVQIGISALAEGVRFETALRRSLKAILCAPEFLFLEEAVRDDVGVEATELALVDDFALASRLSYLFWSSLPDAELLDLAGRDELHESAVLQTQVERMLQDARSERFVISFTDQWLRLRDIDFTVPNNQLYPEYDQLLRQSMLDETRSFFREILEQNLAVTTFLDSDFAMLNQPLAEFYGIEGVTGLEMRRVQLPAGSVRGGVMTHASVLKVSADGTRTSPVMRGAWILKYLFGNPVPPPPATVSTAEPDIRGATTIREQLEKHRNDSSCNRCHRLLDPPGFALEAFDVIGGERQWYRVASGGRHVDKPLHPQSPRHHVRYQQGGDVDTSGVTPDGQTFAGLQEYRSLLAEDATALSSALARMLSAYGGGREPTFGDRSAVAEIVERTRTQGNGLRSLIHEVCGSDLFRQQ